MTPQLVQSIKLLQLSNLDLAGYVEGEIERNPLLQHADDAAAERPPGEQETETGAEGPPGREASDLDRRSDRASAGDASIRLDDGAAANLDPAPSRPNGETSEGYSHWTNARAGIGDGGEHDLEAYVAADATLADHLAAQLVLATADPARRMIGRYLVDLVDEAGYLVGDLAEVGERLGAPLAEVEAVLALLQGFDPPGICARSLAECLTIQLRERNRYDPAMRAMLAHLDLLAKRDFAALRCACGVDEGDLADMIAEVRQLNPKPGLAFGTILVQPIVPDIFVRQAPHGRFMVELNSDTLPKVLVNQSYHSQVSKTAQNAKDRTYLAECLQDATWLVRALDQRARTILKVATEIVRQQEAFFTRGVQYLRPLNLKTVADAIAVHESTVSRVAANKYMATSRGVFELKYFFTSAIASRDGGVAHSAEAVRHRIRQLIDGERSDQVLSDETIVEQLQAAGIEIARRTVAKYRQAMRIPSSMQRRREKQSAPAVAR
jgi:RNA polymerase sigma-54 factor